MKRQIKKVVAAVLERQGHRVIADWQLEKWEQSRHISQLFSFLGINYVLDVGANFGQYREFLRLHVGYHGPLVSFEPVSEMYKRLLEVSEADDQWTVHRLALGESNTSRPINVMRERTLSSFLPRDEPGLRAMGYDKYLRETEVETTEEVPVRRLDAVLPQLLSPGASRVFLKSDTQGYDMSVVRGATGCLDRLLGIQVELSIRHVYLGSPSYLEGLEELQSMGYELTGAFPVQRDSAHRIVNLDCVMIRTDEAERLRQVRKPMTEDN